MYEQGFTQKTKKKQTRSKQKKTNQKTEKKKNKEKQRNKKTWKNPGFDLFLFFFSLVILPICLFFCGEPVFDYVVNVLLYCLSGRHVAKDCAMVEFNIHDDMKLLHSIVY